MEKETIKILQIDVKNIIDLLNKAYADEWLAYYQYWLGAKLAEGIIKDAVIMELNQHADDELRHANMVADRIIQLGGTPVLEPRDWYTFTNCGYAAPKDPQVKILLEQNIRGEQCAIKVYNDLLKEVKDKDFVTYDLALQILKDEIEHEEDLENLLENIKSIK